MTDAKYNLCQVTYCIELLSQAAKLPADNPNYRPADMPVSVFMLKEFLGSKYQASFNAMVEGQRHRIKWEGSDPNKKDLFAVPELSDKLEKPKHRFGWGQ
jgi:hypothetical protein